MWVAGGAAIVVSGVALVVAALLEEGRRPARPSRTGTLRAEELRAADLPVAWRGYDRGHVDALLGRAATTIEQLERYGTLDDASSDPGHRQPERSRRSPAAPPSFLADAVADDSGEELEDRGGDGPGGLDR